VGDGVSGARLGHRHLVFGFPIGPARLGRARRAILIWRGLDPAGIFAP